MEPRCREHGHRLICPACIGARGGRSRTSAKASTARDNGQRGGRPLASGLRALTIRQPWAWLISAGHKNIENRSWRTAYRGPLLIHAAATLAPLEHREMAARIAAEIGIAIPTDLPLGGIVGTAIVVDCIDRSDSPWWIGPHGLVLHDARPLPFLALSGQLSLWRVPDHAAALLDR